MTATLRRLLLTSALTLPAMAGMVHAQESDQPCEDLSAMIEDGVPEDASMSEDELQSIVDEGDEEACSTQLAQLQDSDQAMSTDEDTAEADAEATADAEAEVAEREQTTVQIDEERVVEGVVRLKRQAPQVNVEEGQADVTVSNATPEVSVEQGQPEITVRQPQANVTLEMPQPTVRIEQPAPEITITMPDPSVNVSNAEPQVDVQQAEPKVSVQQAPPQVSLDLRVVDNADASGDGVQVEDEQSGTTYAQGEEQELAAIDDAEISVTKAEPKVTIQQASNQSGGSDDGSGEESDSGDNASSGQSGAANVTVSSAGEPKVNYEASEPNVQVEMQGDPKVEFSQSGEPKITLQNAGDQGEQSENQASDEGEQDTSEMDQASSDSEEQNSDEMDQASSESDAQNSEEMDQASAESDAQSSEDMDQASAESDAQSSEDMDQATAESDAQSSEETDQASAEADQSGSDDAQAENGGEQSGSQMQVEGFAPVDISQVQADALEDSALFNAENDRIGDIEEVVSGDGNSVQQIVVGVGGFLGLGEREVALSMDQLTVMQAEEGDEVRVYTDKTRDELENMPRYED